MKTQTDKLFSMGLIAGLVIATSSASRAVAQPFDVQWFTVSGGGSQTVTGGDILLMGTIGQASAETLTSSQGIEVQGGYWFSGAVYCDTIDFNMNGSFFDPEDIDAFLSVYGEGPCIPEEATCNDIDFNNDGSLFDPCDIDSFLLQFSEGPCTQCGQ